MLEHVARCLMWGGLLLAGVWPAAAQPVPGEAPVRGVVWTVPEERAQAFEDLRQMRQAGVEAVRTGLIRDEALLTLADSLGLQFYQELPVAYLPARTLQRTADEVVPLLDDVLAQARRHPSARHFGLARYSDTSDPAACGYFDALAERVRARGPAGSRTYYVSLFVEDDVCAEQVDFVLLDALDEDRPAQRIQRWRGAHAGVPVGIGALGTWVRADTARGVRVPFSPEAQGRYLERTLHALVADTARAAPQAVFIYRWRDAEAMQELENAFGRSYGLFTPAGVARPSLAVVRGIYTGRQPVFALATGTPSEQGSPWLILLGWGLFAMLGTFYALSPRFRNMVPRYFRAHHFYQDAVREGRDVLMGASTILLVALGCGVGILAAAVVQSIYREEVFLVFLQWMPAVVQDILLQLLVQPWLIIALLGSLYALLIVLWTTLLSAFSRRRYALSPGQALMLAVWPRWPLLLVTVAALLLPTLSPGLAAEGAVAVVAAWALVALYATLRTLFDYQAVTRIRWYMILILLLTNPLVLGMLAVGVLILLQAVPGTTFLWHLAVRA